MTKEETRKPKKFYRAGKLSKPGTKIILKTRPFVSGALFDTIDPITSFHLHLLKMRQVMEQYQEITKIGGLKEAISDTYQFEIIEDDQIELLKNMVEFLTNAPIEFLLKPQDIDEEVISEMLGKGSRN